MITTRPAGMKLAGAGWTVETADLELVSPEGDAPRMSAPRHSGQWLLIKSRGLVFWARTVTEAQKIIGDWDYAQLRVVRQWVYLGPLLENGSWSR